MELFLAFGNGAEARVTFRPRSPSLGLDGQLHRVPPDRGGEGGREPRGNPFIFLSICLLSPIPECPRRFSSL